MCEEVKHPVRQVPRAMAWSIPVGFLTGLFFILPVVFTLPDISLLLSGKFCHDRNPYEHFKRISVSSGQPIGILFTSVMGSRSGGFGMVRLETRS